MPIHFYYRIFAKGGWNSHRSFEEHYKKLFISIVDEKFRDLWVDQSKFLFLQNLILIGQVVLEKIIIESRLCKPQRGAVG